MAALPSFSRLEVIDCARAKVEDLHAQLSSPGAEKLLPWLVALLDEIEFADLAARIRDLYQEDPETLSSRAWIEKQLAQPCEPAPIPGTDGILAWGDAPTPPERVMLEAALARIKVPADKWRAEAWLVLREADERLRRARLYPNRATESVALPVVAPEHRQGTPPTVTRKRSLSPSLEMVRALLKARFPAFVSNAEIKKAYGTGTSKASTIVADLRRRAGVGVESAKEAIKQGDAPADAKGYRLRP